MPAEIHYVNLALLWINATGKVLNKNDPATKLNDIRLAANQEFRVLDNTAGPSAAPNSAGHPAIAQYLELEAADGFAFAYMDQTQLITQLIT